MVGAEEWRSSVHLISCRRSLFGVQGPCIPSVARRQRDLPEIDWRGLECAFFLVIGNYTGCVNICQCEDKTTSDSVFQEHQHEGHSGGRPWRCPLPREPRDVNHENPHSRRAARAPNPEGHQEPAHHVLAASTAELGSRCAALWHQRFGKQAKLNETAARLRRDIWTRRGAGAAGAAGSAWRRTSRGTGKAVLSGNSKSRARKGRSGRKEGHLSLSLVLNPCQRGSVVLWRKEETSWIWTRCNFFCQGTHRITGLEHGDCFSAETTSLGVMSYTYLNYSVQYNTPDMEKRCNLAYEMRGQIWETLRLASHTWQETLLLALPEFYILQHPPLVRD
ncbi:PREDICTED: uncharacterized protein LOC105591348 [Cercocebus atys]|uniref:uncharacterized protein LOC105591348 n=1 Tax=Cercocebus atys TaxID=9531 RepID=UPI0005F3F476|nr:PREDICTED: uncharacterized protein LOC105591348 [Cercocebus atys]